MCVHPCRKRSGRYQIPWSWSYGMWVLGLEHRSLEAVLCAPTRNRAPYPLCSTLFSSPFLSLDYSARGSHRICLKVFKIICAYLFFFLLLIILCIWIHCSCRQTHQKRHQILLHRWLWATMWLLGIELRTSWRAVSVLNLWAISPALSSNFLYWRNMEPGQSVLHSETLSQKNKGQGWRDGSVVKSTCCSSTEPTFNSQPPRGSSLLSVTHVPRRSNILTQTYMQTRH